MGRAAYPSSFARRAAQFSNHQGAVALPLTPGPCPYPGSGAPQGHAGPFAELLFLFAVGLGTGMLSLVILERRLVGRAREPTRGAGASPAKLATMSVVGSGLHNSSAGPAIGQASRAGALSLTPIRISGFGLHHMTEGFGSAAPRILATPPSGRGLALVGLIGGGPTFVGSLVGYRGQVEPVFVRSLTLAAGPIVDVIGELLHGGRRFLRREMGMACEEDQNGKPG